jgi:hypothetical protein
MSVNTEMFLHGVKDLFDGLKVYGAPEVWRARKNMAVTGKMVIGKKRIFCCTGIRSNQLNL